MFEKEETERNRKQTFDKIHRKVFELEKIKTAPENHFQETFEVFSP